MHFSLTSVLYKIDWGEAPFSLQTMRNETHKKARWSGAIKKQKRGESERDWERERGGGEVKHYLGKKAELGKRSLKTQQMTSGSGSATGNTAQSPHRRGRRGPEKRTDTEDEKTEGKKTAICIPVSSSKGSTWLCLEMKSGIADSKVGWRFAAVPHCKAAVAQSRL